MGSNYDYILGEKKKMSTTPLLYQNITTKVQEELIKPRDAIDLLVFFPHVPVEDNTVETLIWKYLGPIGRASLSTALWDPTKVRHAINTLTMKRYSSGIEKNLPYEDWKILLKMNNVADANLAQIVEQPTIQGGYYFLQGKKLLDDGKQGDAPRADQWNFALDVGEDAAVSSLTRPIGCNIVPGIPNTWQPTAGAWATYSQMSTDCNNLVSSLVEKGFTNKANFLIFYSFAAEGALAKKRASGGDGMRNAFQEFEDLGISRMQLIPVDNLYGYTRAGNAPTRALFDLICIDTSSVRIYDPEPHFVNVFMDQSGTKYPGLNIESGLVYIPFFIPEWNVSDSSFRKGVSVITGIIGT